MYGNYLTIECGDPSVALRDLTGAPIESLDNCNDLDKLWNFIDHAQKKSKLSTF